MAPISFCWVVLVLVFLIPLCLFAERQEVQIIKVLIGQQVNVTCHLNSTGDISWEYHFGTRFEIVFACQDNRIEQCTHSNSPFISNNDFNFQATRTNSTSVFSMTPTNEATQSLRCTSENKLIQSFKVKPIDPTELVPTCNVTLPSTDKNGATILKLSCEQNFRVLNVSLALDGIEPNSFHDTPCSFQRCKSQTIKLDDFNNVHNSSCNAYFPDLDVTRSCSYPNIVKAKYTENRGDIIFECDDVEHLRAYNSHGIEEDISDRLWSMKGTRSVLLRALSQQDVGKIVVCQTNGDDNETYGAVVFTVIPQISSSCNPCNTKLSSNACIFISLVLLLSALAIILLVIAVGTVSCLRCKTNRNISTRPNVGYSDHRINMASDWTEARGDPETLTQQHP